MAKNKYLILRDREEMLTPAVWNNEVQASAAVWRLYGVNLKKEWMIFHNGRGLSIYLQDVFEDAANYIADKFIKNRKYFDRISESINKEKKKINKYLQKVKHRDFFAITADESIKAAQEIKKLWLDYDSANVPSWFIAGDRYIELLNNRLGLPESDFLFLTTPAEKTFVNQLEYDFSKCLVLLGKDKIGLDNCSEKLADRYGWIPFNYDGPEYWDKGYFKDKLEKGLKKDRLSVEKLIKKINLEDRLVVKKREELAKRFKLKKEQLRLINIARQLAVWTDERKSLEYKLHYYYVRVMAGLGIKFGMDYQSLKYLLTEELPELKKSLNKIKEISRQRMANKFAIVCENGLTRIMSSFEMEKLSKEVKNQNQQASSEIKGAVASKGFKNIYRGRVKILLSAKNNGKIKKGDFLVATMTSPDYILAMRKAAGFITDEGGVTSHAAIVAREMNKPCIIGTKIATQILRDGDLVEVDVNRGIIKKISK